MLRFIVWCLMMFSIFMCGKEVFNQIKFGSDERFTYEVKRVFFKYDRTDDIEEQSRLWYRYVVNRDFSKDIDKFKENGKTDQDILKFSNNIKTCIDAHITIAKIHKKDDEKWTRKLIKMRNDEFFMYEPNIKEQAE